MKVRKTIFAGTVVLISLGGPAQAQKENSDVYASLSDIPVPLSQMLTRSQYPEQYISQILGIIRQSAKDKTSLTADDINALKEKQNNEQRRRQMQQIVSYDSNFDGKVSRDEVVSVLSSSGQGNEGYISEQASSIMAADIDKDGVITTEEMSTIRNQKSNNNSVGGSKDLSSFLELDPNGDGKLTISELTSLAEKAFHTVDVNADGILSKEELSALQKETRQRMNIAGELSPNCVLPEPQADEKIVFIGVYRGQTVSTMSVAGQVAETSVIPLQIDKGTEKLYIVASAFSPVIWQLKGDTSRIERFVLAGRSMPEGTDNNDTGGEYINVGATGISKDKVIFRRAKDCGMRSAYDRAKEKKKYTLGALTKLLGRTPDLFFVENSVTGVHLFDGRINTDISAALEESQKQAPAGFEKNLWNRHIRFMPGGLIDLSGQEVISDGKAVQYEVLPSWAGIAKLAHEGAIVPYSNGSSSTIVVTRPGQPALTLENIENIELSDTAASQIQFEGSRTFKIVKDIPYFPSGLYGGLSANFVIEKGITLPKGNLGHSTIISGETGEAIYGLGVRH